MLFSTGVFWVFYAFVLLVLQLNFKFKKSIKLQSLAILSASYYFYAYWDWRFLGLIVLVSLQTFLLGRMIYENQSYRKTLLFISVSINVLILGYFKYFNFFARELIDLLGLKDSYALEKIILPVGISFYIFQSLTYVIDIYFKKLSPEKNIVDYFTYIAFFPQLVAGPIERARALLPQFKYLHSISLDNLYTGTKIAVLGLFLKVFIADNVAGDVDRVFSNYASFNGGTLFLGAIYFAIQIYGDFCGYSLIAIGVAKIMGFELMRNFDTPYFSTSIQEFWRRWHISLSTFFRDYVYIPLGGSRVSSGLIQNRNVAVTFLLSGIWHGANWTFMLWGSIHGFLLVVQNTVKVRVPKLLGWTVTMSFVLLLWILFRSESISNFVEFISKIVTDPSMPKRGTSEVVFIIYYLFTDFLLLKFKETESTFFNSIILESLVLAIMLVLVIGTIHDVNPNFIYFQF